MVAVSARIEGELAELDPAEAEEMRESYGVEGSGLARLVRAAYDLLELITFFTAGEDKEAVARPLRRGATAWEAAGTIHTEIQDAFVKAEAIGWEQLVECGGYAPARDKGLLRDRGPRLRRPRRRRDHDQGASVRAMDQGARFPKVRRQGGALRELLHQGLPARRRAGIWIRHTVHKRPGAEPNASIWFVLFDREAEGPRATKVTVPAAELSAPAGSWIRVDGAEIGPGQAEGAVDTDALRPPGSSPSPATPSPASTCRRTGSTRRRLPKTKFVAPYPRRPLRGHARDRRRGRSSSTAGRG